ncbi:MAG: hypothetical protein KDC91_10725 [Flavobacteriaceae bacterium]|nr:hypothetical protein [Flavobacteriaceae bacterium]
MNVSTTSSAQVLIHTTMVLRVKSAERLDFDHTKRAATRNMYHFNSKPDSY